ncbi:MAG: hypothetical protein BWK76_23985 [Desulfobulbaceae bacterium A2]|nr:MAG: hypothetical protein BWK76_23985 [Desulfobulbaceae bacterium A2]
MDFKQLFERSWTVFTAHLPALLISTLVLCIVSIATLGILGPVLTAGYMQSLLLAVRQNRRPEVGDLFGQMRLFLPLLGFSLLMMLAVIVGFAMLILPGVVLIAAICYFCVYMLPLMTDKNMGLMDALKASYRMALDDPWYEHLAVVAIAVGITSLGHSMLLAGLFTQPFATLIVLGAYEERVRRELPSPSAQQPQQPQQPSSPPPPPPPPGAAA